MHRSSLALLSLAVLTASAAAQETAPAPAASTAQASTTYTLTPTPNALMVVIRNDPSTMLQRLGHDHAIVASTFTGTVQWPTAPGGTCAIHIAVPVKSLVVDPDGARDKAGLDDRTIDDGDKAKLQVNMWGKSQLSADTFSEVRFDAEACPGGTGAIAVSGTLTLRGVSKPVTLTMNVKADGTAFHANGSFDTTHTAHGFEPFAGSPFGPRNQDALHFMIDVSGTAKAP